MDKPVVPYSSFARIAMAGIASYPTGNEPPLRRPSTLSASSNGEPPSSFDRLYTQTLRAANDANWNARQELAGRRLANLSRPLASVMREYWASSLEVHGVVIDKSQVPEDQLKEWCKRPADYRGADTTVVYFKTLGLGTKPDHSLKAADLGNYPVRRLLVRVAECALPEKKSDPRLWTICDKTTRAEFAANLARPDANFSTWAVQRTSGKKKKDPNSLLVPSTTLQYGFNRYQLFTFHPAGKK